MRNVLVLVFVNDTKGFMHRHTQTHTDTHRHTHTHWWLGTNTLPCAPPPLWFPPRLCSGLIYFASGAGGFVVSGLFAPYQVTVGASGANFGILAALVSYFVCVCVCVCVCLCVCMCVCV